MFTNSFLFYIINNLSIFMNYIDNFLRIFVKIKSSFSKSVGQSTIDPSEIGCIIRISSLTDTVVN